MVTTIIHSNVIITILLLLLTLMGTYTLITAPHPAPLL